MRVRGPFAYIEYNCSVCDRKIEQCVNPRSGHKEANRLRELNYAFCASCSGTYAAKKIVELHEK